MSLSQTLTTSFKAQLFEGVHDLLNDDIYIALYTAVADLNENTTVYTTDQEITGTGYTAGGEVLNGQTVVVTQPQTGPQTYITFDDAQWSSTSIVARGALIYNSSKGNKAVVVLDFGLDVTPTDGVFTVKMPLAGPNTALLCFAQET